MPITTTRFKEREDGRETTVVFKGDWDKRLPKTVSLNYRDLVFNHIFSQPSAAHLIFEVLDSAMAPGGDALVIHGRVKHKPDFHHLTIPLKTKKVSKAVAPAPSAPKKLCADMSDDELPAFLFLGEGPDGHQYMIDPALLDELEVKAPPHSILYVTPPPPAPPPETLTLPTESKHPLSTGHTVSTPHTNPQNGHKTTSFLLRHQPHLITPSGTTPASPGGRSMIKR